MGEWQKFSDISTKEAIFSLLNNTLECKFIGLRMQPETRVGISEDRMHVSLDIFLLTDDAMHDSAIKTTTRQQSSWEWLEPERRPAGRSCSWWSWAPQSPGPTPSHSAGSSPPPGAPLENIDNFKLFLDCRAVKKANNKSYDSIPIHTKRFILRN